MSHISAGSTQNSSRSSSQSSSRSSSQNYSQNYRQSYRRLFASGIATLVPLLSLLVATAAPMIDSQDATILMSPKELDREWRWEKPGVEYDHMFMSQRSGSRGGQLDWICDGSR